jgi:hypothetical protein
MLRYLLLLLIIVSFSNRNLLAQTIDGKVIDSLSKTVNFANVLLKGKEGNIISFTRTNDKGEFKLTLKEGFTANFIEVSSIGFQKQVVNINPNQKFYTINLKNSSINLPTVVVKNRPTLTVKGDTLNYKTSDFADKQDRTIGDVLKKMPGMEVAEDGKVSYNGKGISNLYIDGDNLLDDKYSIATKSIPQGAVEKVQVIEKDQPIKMLRKNNTSDDVALNLVTTAAAKLKLIGDGKAGLGTPGKVDLGLTGMLFKKKTKFINSLKANNIGEDLGKELTSYNIADFLRGVDNNRPENFLSAGISNVPLLPQNRTLFNRVGVANLNNLYKFSDDLSLKANIGYLNDLQTQFYNRSSETFIAQDTFRYRELQNNTFKPQKLRSAFNLNFNQENNYLNNSLVFDYSPETASSNFVINGTNANQTLSQRTLNFSNDLSWKKKFKNERMVNFYSYLNFSNQPENLAVRPGLNQAFINSNMPYEGLFQEADLPTFYTNNSASLAFTNGKFVQTYKAGFSIQSQQLNTQLFQINSNNENLSLGTKYANTLDWQKNRLYLDPAFDFVTDKWKLSLGVPVSYNQISYSDDNQTLNQSLNRLFINPRVSARIQSGKENYFIASYNFSNNLGGIADIYQGTILSNYRNLASNNSPVNESRTNSFAGVFNYRKAMQMIFVNASINYSNTVLNTISFFQITDNTEQRIQIPLENSFQNLGFKSAISKYFIPLKTTFNIGYLFNQSKLNQFQNNQLLPIKSNANTYNLGFETKVNKFINVAYKTNFSHFTNTTTGTKNIVNTIDQFNQKGTLSMNVFNNVYVNLSAEQIFTQQSSQPNLSYVFADANLKYRILKLKTDLEFNINNITNVKSFETLNVSANSLSNANYNILGRIALLKASFNF